MDTIWEYKIISSEDAEGGGFLKSRSRSDVEAYLNGLGRERWEIVDIDFAASLDGRTVGATTFFGLAKRPVV